MNSTASTVCVCFVGIVIFCICIVSGLSCESRCGEAQGGCSCHATCESLQDCCVDYGQFCLKIAPYSASMLGGSTFMLLNVTFNPSQQLQCRFRGEVVTEGFVDPEGRGHCISPLLYETGWVPFDVSTDGASFRRSGEYLSVHPSKLEPASRLILVNASHWQHYGTADTARVLSMTWNPPVIGAERVDVELWGYREVDNNTETKGNRSASFRAEWTFLYSLGRDLPNNGSFSFIPRPSGAPHSDWRLGSVRVCASTHSVGARNVRAVWSGGHALAWHLEPAFRQDSAAWAWARCLEWDAQERSLPHFLEEVLDCPCTLAQARADTGRFHTDHGCDMEKGSVCTYHPGSVHCVRAIHASPRYGSGQQCCYDHTGNQVLTGDSIGGSTPDRAHDWGSPPYRDPPRVPGLSHWLHDVLSFYYCCLWSNHCQVYFSHRPSSGCRAYQPPRAGSVLGDPHFITFDGLGYSFNGRGEYQLVLSSHKELSIQGRTEQVRLQNGTLAQATMLSSVAMKEKTSDVIEVRLALKQDQLQVLRNQKVLSFSEQSWMDLRGVFLFSPTPHNVTVIFSSGVAVEVRHRMGTMAITVLLSPEFTNYTEGLLGQMNSDPDDDLLTSLGEVINPTNNSPEDLFKFGASWNIWKETSLFTYDTRHLQERYFYPPKHHSDFLPAFSAPEPPGDPLVAAMLDLCYGDGSQFCKFDTMTMQSLAAGNSTLRSYQEHQALLRDLEPVVSCGWLATPRNGQKEGTFYLQGATLKFSCQDGYQFYGSSERTCLEDGTWSGEQAYCLTNNVLGVVLGTAGCLTALITMVVMIKVHTSKQLRKTGPTGRSSQIGTDLITVATPNCDHPQTSSAQPVS